MEQGDELVQIIAEEKELYGKVGKGMINGFEMICNLLSAAAESPIFLIFTQKERIVKDNVNFGSKNCVVPFSNLDNE